MTEQRLIDANAYPCQTCEVSYCYQNCNKFKKWFESTVDAVEVVRCKGCAHCTVTSDGLVCDRALPTKRMEDYYIYGSTILARVAPDDFCSHGERRQEK